jgi:hypothetical protein
VIVYLESLWPEITRQPAGASLDKVVRSPQRSQEYENVGAPVQTPGLIESSAPVPTPPDRLGGIVAAKLMVDKIAVVEADHTLVEPALLAAVISAIMNVLTSSWLTVKVCLSSPVIGVQLAGELSAIALTRSVQPNHR